MKFSAGTRLGTYEIVDLLGKGGMGEVYRARDSKLKREVAIKVLPDGFSHDAQLRFQREAEVLASLNHPHIAAIYDFQDFGFISSVGVICQSPKTTTCFKAPSYQSDCGLPFDQSAWSSLQPCP